MILIENKFEEKIIELGNFMYKLSKNGYSKLIGSLGVKASKNLTDITDTIKYRSNSHEMSNVFYEKVRNNLKSICNSEFIEITQLIDNGKLANENGDNEIIWNDRGLVIVKETHQTNEVDGKINSNKEESVEEQPDLIAVLSNIKELRNLRQYCIPENEIYRSLAGQITRCIEVGANIDKIPEIFSSEVTELLEKIISADEDFNFDIVDNKHVISNSENEVVWNKNRTLALHVNETYPAEDIEYPIINKDIFNVFKNGNVETKTIIENGTVKSDEYKKSIFEVEAQIEDNTKDMQKATSSVFEEL